ncbi:hypothetical protein Droror1_Dr00020338, partial [Drosera rotundifolia]
MCGEPGPDEIPLVPVLLSSGRRGRADRGGFGSRRVVGVRWRCLAGGCGGKVKGFDETTCVVEV